MDLSDVKELITAMRENGVAELSYGEVSIRMGPAVSAAVQTVSNGPSFEDLTGIETDTPRGRALMAEVMKFAAERSEALEHDGDLFADG